MLSDDLTEEERKIRSILKYKRRLRPGKVKLYVTHYIKKLYKTHFNFL